MSAFTDTTLIKKLGDLNSSQQSIQTLSLWLIHHRKHYVTIVKTWAKQIYSGIILKFLCIYINILLSIFKYVMYF